MTQQVIGWALLAAGAFIAVCAGVAWGGRQIDRARERQAAREWNETLDSMQPVPYDGETYEPGPETAWDWRPGYEFEPVPAIRPEVWRTQPAAGYAREQDYDWPAAGEATRHFFGTDLVAYDPEADAAEYMRKQASDTAEFMALLTAETEPVPA